MIYLQDADFTLHQGDALEVLRTLPDESVHMCVTSPPFYGLRNYNVDGQIGLEASPDLWVAALVDVFREVRRVLRSDGTLWLEIGDSYGANQGKGFDTHQNGDVTGSRAARVSPTISHPYKPKDLIGAPWLLAFALRADGWYLRSDIIWARPNPMPESVRDRPTKSHSYVFLLSKSPRYFFDQEAVREPHTYDGRTKLVHDHAVNGSHENYSNMGTAQERWPNGGRNIRSVWTIPTEPLPDEHYAAYPSRLVERCILAGTSERGCCPECGAPWERMIEREFVKTRGDSHRGKKDKTGFARCAEDENPLGYGRYEVTTTGWNSSCRRCAHELEPVPAVVLDPFLGSGTTALVARKHGRKTIGIELSSGYCAMAARRLSQLSLLA